MREEREAKEKTMRMVRQLTLIGGLFTVLSASQPSSAQANPARVVWRCFSNGWCGWVASTVVVPFVVQRAYDCYYNGKCTITREIPNKERNKSSTNQGSKNDRYYQQDDDDDDGDEDE